MTATRALHEQVMNVLLMRPIRFFVIIGARCMWPGSKYCYRGAVMLCGTTRPVIAHGEMRPEREQYVRR